VTHVSLSFNQKHYRENYNKFLIKKGDTMKKFLLALMLVGAVSAVAATKSVPKAQYPDGTYRGVYISGQETQVEVQFNLKNDVITDAKYRTLFYKGHDWLKEDDFIAKNDGYMKLLERITNKKIQDVMPTMYNSEEIEKGYSICLYRKK